MLEKAAETTAAIIGEYYFLFLISFSFFFSSLFFFLPFLSVLFFIDLLFFILLFYKALVVSCIYYAELL